MEPPSTNQYSGPITTANSNDEGRLRVDTGGMKKMILQKLLDKVTGKMKSVKIKMKMK